MQKDTAEMVKQPASFMRTCDGFVILVGAMLYIVEEAHVDDEERWRKVAQPKEVEVLRISDGEKRSVLLRHENGVERRWYPTEYDIQERGLFGQHFHAKVEAKRRNQIAADKQTANLARLEKELRQFKRVCGLK